MPFVSRTFSNELGNSINVEVDAPGAHSVYVRITGPKSQTSMILTKMEASVLQDALEVALEPPY